MKINGIQFKAVNEEVIPVIRSTDSANLYFVARAVEDLGEFDNLCPAPKAPMMEKPGQAPQPVESTAFRKQVASNAASYFDFIVVKSLTSVGTVQEQTDPETKSIKKVRVYQPIVWETVDLGDILTYKNYQQELKDLGLNTAEINRIVEGVMVANSLSVSGIEEAKRDFLALPVAD